MTIEIKAPSFPESISEGELVQWYKKEGDYVDRDELLCDVETEKTTLEVPSPVAGLLVAIVKPEGEIVESEELLARLDETAQPTAVEPAEEETAETAEEDAAGDAAVAPAARKLAEENGVDLEAVTGSGRRGRITKEDVARYIATLIPPDEEIAPVEAPPIAQEADESERVERRVPMTRLRATIAQRLVDAQHTAAMLTTFNEADMQPIMRMRQQYQEEFTRQHNGTRLGFMSFFVRASVEALKRFPSVNASIDASDIIYHGYYDIGVAVSTDRGLVVPVIRDADALGMAQIEDQISEFVDKASSNKLSLEEMQGGTFTISNGGVFGSLMSTPILNPPQTAILGMHKIQERPVVEDGEVVVRPMMYLALSYDHRLIDGSEAVRFLVTIKGMLEDPARILLEL